MIYFPMAIVRVTGAAAATILRQVGVFAIFVSATIRAAFKRFYWKQFRKYLFEIGFYSLPVVGITAVFTGAVLAMQSYNGFARFSAQGAVASVVVLSITRELGPVLSGLMVAGRVGAAIAAELASMKVTEQLEAMQTLSTNPLGYLVAPRVLAATIMLPVLVIIADIIGVFGGFIIATTKLGFLPGPYLVNTFKYLENFDVISGLIKASSFGFIVAIVSSYQGYHAERGAQGVGIATTKAVVNSSMLILAMNYFITQLIIGS